MKRFEYSRADAPKQAATSASSKDASFIAGGTNLLDLMKQNRNPNQTGRYHSFRIRASRNDCRWWFTYWYACDQ